MPQKRGKKILFVDKNTLITPSARDKAKELKIEFSDAKESSNQALPVRTTEWYAAATISSTDGGSKLIVIGSDHGGFQTKEMLKKYLESLDTARWI